MPDPDGRGTLLFFVSPTCPVCKELLSVLPAVCAAEDPQLRLLLVSDGPREEHEDLVRRHGLGGEHYHQLHSLERMLAWFDQYVKGSS